MKKNPIYEISCQISFSDDIKNNLPTNFNDHFRERIIKNGFPESSNEKQFDLNLHINKDNTIEQNINQKVLHKFISADKNKTILLCDSFCVLALDFKENRSYKKWKDDFYPTLDMIYKHLQEILSLQDIKSVGIRYINKINPNDFDLKWSELFNQKNDYLPKKILSPHENNGHISLLQFNPAINQKLIIQTAYQPDNSELLLDIDAITENITLNDFEESIDATQKRVEDSFFDIISDKFKKKIERA